MASYWHGFATAIGLMAAGAFLIAGGIFLTENHLRLSDPALSDIAQIGATLLVAYAIEMSWVVKESRTRGSEREGWVGFVTGIGLCSAAGIVLAVAFVGKTGPTSFLEALGGVWMLFSLGFLGLLVAMLPYLLYELARAVHIDPDD